MKALKIGAIVLIAYAGLVVAFESMIGFMQPETETTLVIRTFDADGSSNDRVLARLESDGKVYVASNHWPRGWYHRTLAHPDVEIVFEGETKAYRAVEVTDEDEFQRVDGEHARGLGFKFFTGFPPRYLLRLEPS